MRTASMMTSAELEEFYRAEEAYQKRVDERAMEIAKDGGEVARMVGDDPELFGAIYSLSHDPKYTADQLSKIFWDNVHRIAREQAEREIKPDEMDGYVEPLGD